jgi:rare lipoprotein A
LLVAALAVISLVAVRSNSTTPQKSVTLMADSSVDFASRLSAPRASRSANRAPLVPVASTTTTTTPPPPTTKPKPVVKAVTVTTAKPAPKKTAAAPKPAPSPTPAASNSTATTSSPRPMPERGGQSNSQEGRASWYDAKYHQSNPWICAHKTIPIGTVLTVTNVNTGAWITCEVGDRGPYVEGRILDLSKYAFSKLANPSSGLVWVKITY